MTLKHGIPENAWVVVADGHGARVFVNQGKEESPKLTEKQHLKPHDLLGEGPSGNRPQGDTPRDTDEATFSKQLAHWLYQQAHQGAYSQLVLAADPATLGEIRPQLHKEVQQRIVREVAKTLTNQGADDVLRSVTN